MMDGESLVDLGINYSQSFPVISQGGLGSLTLGCEASGDPQHLRDGSRKRVLGTHF